ncbi:MAG: winged helix-turn-helix transcriptional regulator [Patescibacteria group bacterium]|nr:winged helix-turn-helix transcriptional regulator [Patescibacteria group bacterium]MDE2437931.1 winged helix-turn-helix transcriptional regulator [Patescibacteria group bacterium]
MHQDETLINLIITALRTLREHTTRHGKIDRFSIAQFKILCFVARQHNPTMKEVAHHLSITPPSTTVLIHRMIAAGALKKIHDTHDRRIIHLSLTAQGKNKLKEKRKKITSRIHALISHLTQEEKQQLTTILSKIMPTSPSL